MEQNQNQSSRKKFVTWGLAILASATVLRFIIPGKKKKGTVKMLTQDGKLVEVDKDLVSGYKRKITEKELKRWVKNKTTQH